jgi:uncharacterized RDD family membrane protein YckC
MLNLDRRVRGLLATEAERTVDAALASNLVEAVARSLAVHDVPARLGDEVLVPTVELVLRSPAVRAAVAELIASEELRGGLEETATGFAAELAERLQRLVAGWDDEIHARARRFVHAEPVPAPSRYGGIGARAAAFLLDLVLVQLLVVVGAASVSIVLSLVGAHGGGLAMGLAGGAAWLLTVAVYFAVFWSLAGQTPGMRVLGLRLQTEAGGLPSLLRSLLRFAGLLVAIAVPVAGVPVLVLTTRRRGLQDVAARTVVLAQSSAWTTNAVANPSVVATPTSFPP